MTSAYLSSTTRRPELHSPKHFTKKKWKHPSMEKSLGLSFPFLTPPKFERPFSKPLTRSQNPQAAAATRRLPLFRRRWRHRRDFSLRQAPRSRARRGLIGTAQPCKKKQKRRSAGKGVCVVARRADGARGAPKREGKGTNCVNPI